MIETRLQVHSTAARLADDKHCQLKRVRVALRTRLPHDKRAAQALPCSTVRSHMVSTPAQARLRSTWQSPAKREAHPRAELHTLHTARTAQRMITQRCNSCSPSPETIRVLANSARSKGRMCTSVLACEGPARCSSRLP